MFGLFKKKKKSTSKAPQLADLEGQPIQEGDVVEALRYDLGKAKLVKDGDLFAYESIATGQKVHFLKMVDAVTGYQKVKKITTDDSSGDNA